MDETRSKATMSRNNVEPLEKVNSCCKIRCCRRSLEENVCCRTMGKCGVIDARSNKTRRAVFGIATFLSIVSLLLRAFMCIGTSEEAGAVETFSWAYGDLKAEQVDVDVYLGANILVFSTPNNTVVTHWDDVACNNTYCDDCKKASHGQVAGTYFSILGGIGQIATDFTRYRYATDYNCQKTAGMISGLIGILSNIGILSAFQSACVSSVNDNLTALETDVQMGPGMIFLLVSTGIAFLDICAHAIVPTPEERHERTDGTKRKSGNALTGGNFEMREG